MNFEIENWTLKNCNENSKRSWYIELYERKFKNNLSNLLCVESISMHVLENLGEAFSFVSILPISFVEEDSVKLRDALKWLNYFSIPNARELLTAKFFMPTTSREM